MQTEGPEVQLSVVEFTIPSAPTDPPPEQIEYSAWQINGAGQSATVLHACSLATQVPLVPVCGVEVVHPLAEEQVGPLVSAVSITQSKSALGQSATLVQTMGLASQVPVATGAGTGGGGDGIG